MDQERLAEASQDEPQQPIRTYLIDIVIACLGASKLVTFKSVFGTIRGR